MTDYFDSVIAAYAQVSAPLVDGPWIDPEIDRLEPIEAEPIDRAAHATDFPRAPTRREADNDDVAPAAPALVDPLAALFDDRAGDAEPPGAPVEAAAILREHTFETHERIEIHREDRPPGADPAPFHWHEHVDRSITRIEEILQIVEPSGFEPAIESDSEAPHPLAADAPPVDLTIDHGPRLAALEDEFARALARIDSEDATPPPFFAEDDFEPAGADRPMPVEIEPQREITREVVREIHHHHHTETKPAAAPSEPPPRSAAQASRIGPIRFQSDWKTGIG